jgi:hypothetical protein
MANRPLNARVNGRLVRLASHDRTEAAPAGPELMALFDETVAVLNRRLEALNVAGSIEDVPLIRDLRARWTTFGDPEAVGQVFREALYPLLRSIYADGIPPTDWKTIQDLQARTDAFARVAMSRTAQEFRDRLAAEGRIPSNDPRPLQFVACEALLKAGVDQVLVGMRRPDYVDALEPLMRFSS